MDRGDGVLWPLEISDSHAFQIGGPTYDADLTLTVTPGRTFNSAQRTQKREQFTIVLTGWIDDEHQCSIHLVSNAHCTPPGTFRSRKLKEKIGRGSILSGG